MLESTLDSIENFDPENILDYTIRVHGIKGSSMEIASETIGNQAKVLEDAAIKNDIDYIYRFNPHLIGSIKKMIADFNAVLAVIKADNQKPIKDKPDDELFVRMISACKNCEIEAVEEIMSLLEEYQYNDGEELIECIRRSVDMLNFSQVIETINKF
jgi:glutamyl/glutaminyl-tRNA synthetase